MTRRQRKPKAGSQKSKKKRKVGSGSGGSATGSATGSTGMMSGMRSAFKSTVGSGKSKKQPGTLSKVIDIGLWIAVAGAIGYFIVNAQCTQ